MRYGDENKLGEGLNIYIKELTAVFRVKSEPRSFLPLAWERHLEEEDAGSEETDIILILRKHTPPH